jgi:hypothetical protein
MATLEQLRQALGDPGLSDAQVIQQVSQQSGIDLSEIADEVKYDGGMKGKNSERMRSSVSNYIGGLQSLGSEVAKRVGLHDVAETLGGWSQDNAVRQQVADARAARQGAISRFTDDPNTGTGGVHGISDFVDYGVGLGLQSLPYFAEAALGGAVGRGLMTGTRAALMADRAALAAARTAGSAEAEAISRTAVAAGEETLDRASVAGSVAASYPSSMADIVGNQRQQIEDNGGVGGTDLLAAAAGAVPYALLNAFEPSHLAASTLSGFRAPAILDGMRGLRGGAARMAATAGVKGLEEGANELGQELINQRFGRMAVDPNATMTGGDAMDRYVESFAGGAVLGGAAGGLGGGWRRSENAHARTDEQDAARRPPVNDAPGSSTDILQIGYNGRLEQGSGQAPSIVFPDGSTATPADAELMRRNGIPPDRPALARTDDPKTDPTMAAPGSGGVAPSMPGKMVADQGGQVALDAPGAGALSGRENGDPGLALARQRFLEQEAARDRATAEQEAIDRATAEQEAIDRAAQEYAQRSQAAHSALVPPGPNGKPSFQLKQQDVILHHDLMQLRAAGDISPETYVSMAGAIKAGLMSGNKGAVNDVRKEVRRIVAAQEAPQGGQAATPATPPSGAAGAPAAGRPAPVSLRAQADPRAAAALGSGSTLRALELGTQLFHLVDQGKVSEDDIVDHMNSLVEAKPKYAAVQTFIEEAKNAQPRVPGVVAGPAGGGVGGGVDASGGSGDLGRVATNPGDGGAPPAGEPVARGAASLPVGDGHGGSPAALSTAPAAPYAHPEEKSVSLESPNPDLTARPAAPYAHLDGKSVSLEIPNPDPTKRPVRRVVKDARAALEEADARIKKFTELAECLRK